MKRGMSRLEREWWDERIRKCEEACAEGRVGEMYKCLHKIGTKGKPTGIGTTVTANEFKEFFESVMKERYEEEPGEIERAVNEAKDLRQSEKARRANVRMDEVPSEEEIRKVI